MTLNNAWAESRSTESLDGPQGQDFAKTANTKVASTTVEAMVEAEPNKSSQSSEIQALRAKMKTLERNVDTRLANLEDDNESSGERLTKLEMEALLGEDNDGLEAKVIQLQGQVDQLLGEAALKVRVEHTTARDGKNQSIDSANGPAKSQEETKVNSARTKGNQINTTSLNADHKSDDHNNTSWYMYAIPCMGIVWLFVAVMVAAFAAADNNPTLFASSVKDCAKILVLLLLWGWFIYISDPCREVI